jgi:hypothetical protein
MPATTNINCTEVRSSGLLSRGMARSSQVLARVGVIAGVKFTGTESDVDPDHPNAMRIPKSCGTAHTISLLSPQRAI